MNGTRVAYAVMALSGTVGAFVAPAAHAQAPASRFVGRWQMNMAQTKAMPGETPPASLVTQIDRADTEHVHWSTTTTDAKGQKDVQTFDTPGNGQFYSLNGYTMVANKVSPSSLEATFKDDATGQTDALTCTLSANASQMTCKGVVSRQDGTTLQYADVFDRL